MNTNLKHKLLGAVDRCFTKAIEIYKINMPYPIINLNYKSRVGGGKIVFSKLTSVSTISFNFDLYKANPEQFINEIVPHEVAHAVSLYLGHGGHGPQWKSICLKLGGNGRTYLSKNLCSTFDEIRKGYIYTCACTTHSLSPTRHKRASQGIAYRCSRCKGLLTLQQQGRIK